MATEPTSIIVLRRNRPFESLPLLKAGDNRRVLVELSRHLPDFDNVEGDGKVLEGMPRVQALKGSIEVG